MIIETSDKLYEPPYLRRVKSLKKELDSLRPINAEMEARIMQKFRLDWNYHSNHLEGNSLSYDETKALILFGLTARGKPLEDHIEMSDHNTVLERLLEVVKGEYPLTESFIRDIHKLLFTRVTELEIMAETPDGKPTTRKIEVGRYKTQPNHVITVTGETFYFATPEETPAKMHDLLEWFRREKEKSDVNPIILATLFHYRFIRIHPFDDGNGRTARILMNFILMQFGYPPVIIKTEDKENYYAVLRLADADELEPFIEYITQNLIRSLEIMIKGAKGESIEEPDDLDKELALLERKISNAGRRIEIIKSKESVLRVFDESISVLIKEFVFACGKFKRFYVESGFTLFLDGAGIGTSEENYVLDARKKIDSKNSGASDITLRYFFSIFNQEHLGECRFDSRIFVKFGTTHFRVSSFEYPVSSDDNDGIIYEKLYSEKLTSQEINSIIKLKINQHKEFIEKVYEDWELQCGS